MCYVLCVGYRANGVANGLLVLCHSSGRCYIACSVVCIFSSSHPMSLDDDICRVWSEGVRRETLLCSDAPGFLQHVRMFIPNNIPNCKICIWWHWQVFSNLSCYYQQKRAHFTKLCYVYITYGFDKYLAQILCTAMKLLNLHVPHFKTWGGFGAHSGPLCSST